MRVVVIGSGLGGLSAAAHLAGAGHDVSVVEKSSSPGGSAGAVSDAGFRLDIGPAVLTMPNLLADVFRAAGQDMADHVEIRPVDPMYRLVFHDGSELFVRQGREAMVEEIRNFAGAGAADGFVDFTEWLRALYQVEMPNYIDSNFDSIADLLRPWKAMLRLARLGGFGRLDRKVATFFDDERLRRAFSFQSLYAGVAPHKALALYGVITYMDSVEGVYAPVGGIHAIARGLAGALVQADVSFRYDTHVTRILRGSDGATTGVELDDGQRVRADAVVCNADLSVAYRTLLGGVEPPRVVRRGTYSPSCVLWVAGVRGEPTHNIARHNIHFGEQWRGSFDALFGRGKLMPDPSTMVTMHSIDDASLAPPGCSTLYALEPVPNLDGKIDWSREREQVATRLRDRVAALGYPTDVVTERVYDPLDWELLGSERGTPFGLAHTFRQTGPFRPNNVVAKVPGLVFTGSSTLPGVGVPMVLISGKLAAERVADYERDTSVVRW